MPTVLNDSSAMEGVRMQNATANNNDSIVNTTRDNKDDYDYYYDDYHSGTKVSFHYLSIIHSTLFFR